MLICLFEDTLPKGRQYSKLGYGQRRDGSNTFGKFSIHHLSLEFLQSKNSMRENILLEGGTLPPSHAQFSRGKDRILNENCVFLIVFHVFFVSTGQEILDGWNTFGVLT